MEKYIDKKALVTGVLIGIILIVLYKLFVKKNN